MNMAHKEFTRIVEGSDTAVLMVHGICGTPNHFRELIPLVPADWSVHALLLPGHGGTVEDFARSSLPQWKNHVFARLEELLATHGRVFIAAHSMGTLFAIQASVKYPGRIAGLFLLGSPTRPFVAPYAAVNAVKLQFGVVDPADKSAVDMRDGCSVDGDPRLWKYVTWIPRFLELFREIAHTRPLLGQIPVRTMVFQSRKDELVHPSSYADFQGFERIESHMLEDSGHFGYGEADLALLKRKFLELIQN